MECAIVGTITRYKIGIESAIVGTLSRYDVGITILRDDIIHL